MFSRRSGSRELRAAMGGLVSATMLAACSPTEIPTAPVELQASKVSNTGGPINPTWGYIRVCKAGGPPGTYNFTASVASAGGTFGYEPTFSIVFDGSTVNCVGVWGPLDDGSWADGETATVQITETLADGFVVPKIDVYNVNLPFPGFLGTFTNTNTVTVTLSHLDRYKIYFYNAYTPPPPPGGFGCTPGYWKQQQHFDSWVPTGLSPTETVASVFANAAIHALGNYSLVEGLSFKGGSTLQGAAGNLLRAAIAAQLNARHPDVGAPLTAAAMVTAVNNALASGSRETMLGLAAQFDTSNNLGCILN